MRKLIFIALLAVLVGCGQTPHTAPTSHEQSGKPTSTQIETENVEQANQKKIQPKDVEPKNIYADVFDQPDDPIIPKNLTIDSIGVDATVEEVGTAENGEMDVPKDYKNLGWFASGTIPGEQGNAAIDGHVSDPDGKGVFWDLEDLEPGDEVTVSDEFGETLVFTVVDKEAFDLGEAPIKKIFGYTSRRALNLITCTGDFNYDKGTHNKRLVVYTELKRK